MFHHLCNIVEDIPKKPSPKKQEICCLGNLISERSGRLLRVWSSFTRMICSVHTGDTVPGLLTNSAQKCSDAFSDLKPVLR